MPKWRVLEESAEKDVEERTDERRRLLQNLAKDWICLYAEELGGNSPRFMRSHFQDLKLQPLLFEL